MNRKIMKMEVKIRNSNIFLKLHFLWGLLRII